MSKFPEAWMDELLSRSDIVSVISEYTTLREKGRRLWGLCPFHGEKTASFSVSPDKQLFYCFGCHAGGNVVQFIMSAERFSFVEAVKHLAQRANLTLPEETDDEDAKRERDKKERLYAICREAAVFFHKALLSDSGKTAREYFLRRGVSEQTIVRFGLGCSLDSWDALLHHLKALGFSEADICDAGLAINKQGTDRCYDAFRARAMFPIIGTHQKVIGFGGRTLGNDNPKYINTPETPIFNKRMHLYGLNQIKGKNPDSLVVVEGYMDVVSLHQGGVTNAVASLGTALTSQQAKLIKRYCDSVYIAYDGDSAGQHATIRGLDILSAEGLSVKVVEFPNGQDPDDFIRAYGQRGFEERQASALSLSAFKLKNMAAKFDLMSENGREAYALEGCKFIATLLPVEQERCIVALSRETGYSVSALRKQAEVQPQNESKQQATSNRLTNYRNTRTTEKAPPVPPLRMIAEQTLLKMAFSDSACAQKIAACERLFLYEPHKRLANGLVLFFQEKGKLELAAYFSELSAQDAEVAAGIIASPDVESSEELWRQTVIGIEKMDGAAAIAKLQEEAERDDTLTERRLALAKEIREWNARLLSLQK